MNLSDIKQCLRNAPVRYSDQRSDELRQELTALKQEAVRNGDEAGAKEIWCLEQILEAQEQYISAFLQMKAGAYYDAWCRLERAEVALHFLSHQFEDHQDEYYVRFMAQHIRQYQALFPYKLFLSPETIIIRKSCSICGAQVSIRRPCGHIPGDIYSGEMCVHRIEEFQAQGMAVVESPMQKYSVIFLTSETGERIDHYNYGIVKYLMECLQSPFHAWDYEQTKIRHPHERYRHIGRNDLCPCESGKKYKKCCLRESGVLRPHIMFTFSEPVPEHLLEIQYHD